MVLVTLFVLLSVHSRQGGFSTQLALTVFYNVYIWHIGCLYMPIYHKKELELGEQPLDGVKAQNFTNADSEATAK